MGLPCFVANRFKITVKMRVGFTLLSLSDTWKKYIGAVKHIFYCFTVHYGMYILFTHQQMHFFLNWKSLN